MTLQEMYERLDQQVAPEHTTLIDGKRVVISGLAYAKPLQPETTEEWLARLRGQVSRHITMKGPTP